jgi:hypothetical protein
MDLLIISSNIPAETLKPIIFTMEKTIKRNINIHQLPNLSKSSAEFKNNVANGIVLHGYLKVV